MAFPPGWPPTRQSGPVSSPTRPAAVEWLTIGGRYLERARGDRYAATTGPTPTYPETLSTPRMKVWMEQWKSYEPGVEGATNISEVPGMMGPVLKCPCGLDPGKAVSV